MMMTPQKKIASAILAKMGSAPSQPDADGAEPGAKEASMSAASAIIQAIQGNDPQGLALALKSFIDVIDDVPEEDGDEDGPDSNGS